MFDMIDRKFLNKWYELNYEVEFMPSTEKLKIIADLEAIRKELGKSLFAVCGNLGISDTMYRMIRDGKKFPTQPLLVRYVLLLKQYQLTKEATK